MNLTIEEALKALRSEFYPCGEDEDIQNRFEYLLNAIWENSEEMVRLAHQLAKNVVPGRGSCNVEYPRSSS